MAKARVCTYRGNLSVRWRNRAGQERLKRCPSRRAAEALRDKLNYHFSQGEDWDPDTPEAPPAPPTDLWTVIADYQALKFPRLRGRSANNYASALEYFMDFLEGRKEDWHDYTDGVSRPPVDLLTRALLEDFLVWTLDPANSRHGHGRKPHVAGDVVAVVERLWAWAEESERWEDIPRPRRIDKPSPPKPDPVAPTWAQLDAMLTELASQRRYTTLRTRGDVDADWPVKLGILVRYTGMRKVAALLTVWADVDLVGARLRIPAENTKGGYGGREIPLHPDLVERLRRWGPGEGRVIKAPEKELPPHRGHIDRSFRRAWQRTDTPPAVYARHPIHGVRHLIETEWSGQGIHQSVIDGFLGHAAQGVGGRHYRVRRSPQLWQATVAAVATMPRLLLPDELPPVRELHALSGRPRLKG